ncbi:hypothetical protein [Paenibacillus periandrae]|uniref:hypothetical protein n=1 Tax=Paenibacillus periandrae TaxID=1761741 RepID=UPI001F08EDE0|nr:hypothetical protein [Paenibacillus periandrae]
MRTIIINYSYMPNGIIGINREKRRILLEYFRDEIWTQMKPWSVEDHEQVCLQSYLAMIRNMIVWKKAEKLTK